MSGASARVTLPGLLRGKAAGLTKGTSTPSKEIVGSITIAQAREIAATKMPDLNAVDMDGAVMMIRGSARSMGVEVVG